MKVMILIIRSLISKYLSTHSILDFHMIILGTLVRNCEDKIWYG